MLHVIIGPPCAGKSTYAQEHMQEGDVVVDFDALAHALGATERHNSQGAPREAAFKARTAVIDYLVTNSKRVNGWVIHSTPSEAQMRRYDEIGADIIELDPGMDECLRRAEQDGRPDGTAESIRQYYEKGNNMAKFKDARDAAQVDGGTVIGYASTFDRDPDAYGDVIAKGAFAKTLKEWEEKRQDGVYIPLLYGHSTDDPAYNIGRVTSAVEDDRGLLIEAEFDPDNEKAQYVRKLVKEGRLYQFSFAFDCTDFGEVTLEDGRKANELRELALYEVSLVQIPANQHAEVVDVKSAKSGRRNSAADTQKLVDILDNLDDIIEEANETKNIVNGLLADNTEQEQPKANAEEQKANAEERKASVIALLDEAEKFLK